MKVNVSQLLKQSPGTTRNLTVDEQITGKKGEVFIVAGDLLITRTGRGIYITGVLNIESKEICCRCLEPFKYSCKLNLEEEFLPTTDINTGLPVSVKDDVFLIDEHHQIDLGEALYQYACMSLPMRLLCKENCAGICPTCGKNLNKGKCACSNHVEDKRWAKLSALRKEGKH